MAKDRAFHPEAEPHLAKAKRAYRRRTEFDPESIAPERFEHFETPRYEFLLSRRSFWQSGAGIADGLFASARPGRKVGGAPLPEEISSRFLFEVRKNYRIHREGGTRQGSRTLLSQAVAEEFFMPFAQVSLVMGDTGRVPDGGTWASLTRLKPCRLCGRRRHSPARFWLRRQGMERQPPICGSKMGSCWGQPGSE